MNSRFASYTLIVVCCFSIIGCSGLFGENNDEPPAPQALTYSEIASDAVRIDQLEEGTFSDIREGRNLLITDQGTLAELWTSIHADQSTASSPPPVDFSESIVVAVVLGQRPTSGYEVEIQDLQLAPDSGRLEVGAVERQPGGSCIVNQVLTSPYVIVRAEADRPVSDATFNVTQEAYPCDG